MTPDRVYVEALGAHLELTAVFDDVDASRWTCDRTQGVGIATEQTLTDINVCIRLF